MRIHKPILLFTGLIILIIGWSCSSNTPTYSNFKNINSEGWNQKVPITFSFDSVKWSMSPELSVVIRHDIRYPYKNLWLYIDYIDNTGKIRRQKVHADIADDNGNWYGRGFGALYEYSILLNPPIDVHNLKNLVVWQGMDVTQIIGLTNVGIVAE